MIRKKQYIIGLLSILFLSLNVSSKAEKKPINPKIILFLGNSLTAGYGLEPEHSYPALIQEKIDQEDWNFEVVNGGLSGDTTAGALRRLDWVLKREIHVLVVALGSNDGLRGLPVSVTQENLQSILDKTWKKYPQSKIILAGQQMPPNMGPDYTSQFKKIYPKLAKNNELPFVPFLLRGVGGKHHLNLPDGIHPTREGHEILANNVWEILEPVLKEFE